MIYFQWHIQLMNTVLTGLVARCDTAMCKLGKNCKEARMSIIT